jgi:hypothetical protein
VRFVHGFLAGLGGLNEELFAILRWRRFSRQDNHAPHDALCTRHNLRASRETELAAQHPIHVVCKWIGNSAANAQKHYLQVTEGDFHRAAWGAAKSGAVSPENALQNAVQSPAGSDCQESPEMQKAPENRSLVQLLSIVNLRRSRLHGQLIFPEASRFG